MCAKGACRGAGTVAGEGRRPRASSIGVAAQAERRLFEIDAAEAGKPSRNRRVDNGRVGTPHVLAPFLVVETSIDLK